MRARPAKREGNPSNFDDFPQPAKPPNSPKPPSSLGALGGLGDSPRSEPAIASEGKDEPVTPADPAEIETLALALLAEAERHPAQRITDREKATLYFRGEAMRRLDLIRQRAIDAKSGPDIEREAIQAEEAAPMLPAEAHNAAVAPLLRAASPLTSIPGARPCPACGRGIWCSPSWRGSLPTICRCCELEDAP